MDSRTADNWYRAKSNDPKTVPGPLNPRGRPCGFDDHSKRQDCPHNAMRLRSELVDAGISQPLKDTLVLTSRSRIFSEDRDKSGAISTTYYDTVQSGNVRTNRRGTGRLCRTERSLRLFVRRCTSKYSNEATFPKLNVVLAIHWFGSTSRRLLINAVELGGANHVPAAVYHEHFVPHDAVPSQRGSSPHSNVRLRPHQT